jgi:hypothetical protein
MRINPRVLVNNLLRDIFSSRVGILVRSNKLDSKRNVVRICPEVNCELPIRFCRNHIDFVTS